MNKLKIYLSGKITDLPFNEVQKAFGDVENIFTEMGYEVVNPLKNGLSEENSWEELIARDIEMLLYCDCIFMFANWEDSRGARIEYAIAKELNLKFITLPE